MKKDHWWNIRTKDKVKIPQSFKEVDRHMHTQSTKLEESV